MKIQEILTAEKIDFTFFDVENLPDGPEVFVAMSQVIGQDRPFGFWVELPNTMTAKETQEIGLELIIQRYEKK